MHVAGARFSELDQMIRAAVGKIYRNFDLSVELGAIRSIQIYVTGEGRRPGVYTVSSLSTLVDALFSSGGPSVQGSMRRIELRRGIDRNGRPAAGQGRCIHAGAVDRGEVVASLQARPAAKKVPRREWQ